MTTQTLTDSQLSTLATLQVKLISLGVDGEFKKEVREGPVVTLFKFIPRNATRVSLVERLAPDMAVALGAEAVQVRRLPGEAAIGIYVPNKVKRLLPFRDSVTEVWKRWNSTKGPNIPVCLGWDHEGELIVDDLTTMPHLLIAGATGSGKSTLLNSIIASIVYCCPPSAIKLVLFDTKQVEFGHFIGAPHLLFSPAQSVYQALEQMTWVVDEIEDRLRKIGKAGYRNIHDYNHAISLNEVRVHRLPFIILVIDELADLLTHRGKNEEEKISIGKLAEHKLGTIVQKARAAGVYVIAAVQRPSVRVVEGNIKANFPARISFRLPSEADSRTVLGSSGAEQLLSQGDMLFLSPNAPGIRRLHAPFTSIEDVQAAVEVACRREQT